MGTGDKQIMDRRRFISLLGWLAVLPISGMWGSMLNRMKVHDGMKTISIKLEDIPEGISQHNKYVINRAKDGMKVFSSRCSHLGCRIKAGESGTLVCPCHGSEFNSQSGEVLKGPAAVALNMPDYKIENDLLTIYTD